jgi:hypothetical protein
MTSITCSKKKKEPIIKKLQNKHELLNMRVEQGF